MQCIEIWKKKKKKRWCEYQYFMCTKFDSFSTESEELPSVITHLDYITLSRAQYDLILAWSARSGKILMNGEILSESWLCYDARYNNILTV